VGELKCSANSPGSGIARPIGSGVSPYRSEAAGFIVGGRTPAVQPIPRAAHKPLAHLKTPAVAATEPPADQAVGVANLSLQRMRPVICITKNRVRMEPMVITRPVKPLKKKAYENSTR